MLFRKKKLEKKIKKSTKPSFKDVLTAILASVAAAFLLLLAGLSLAGTAVAFVTCMPLFVICSPVLIPAGITTTVLASGLLAGGSSGASALKIILWLLKKLAGQDASPSEDAIVKPSKLGG
ncbi:Oleosin-B1 [Cardamine amara subsp. amara]|uniref:Oleosin-B1 n=1 Tax=Cardamine amara subsp. amara TaxID=228776 RepID=A0ABD0ZQ94_CARAN